ncbi:uncharacterized protein MELLADRAFT_113216 [Melampsora larici-populina 98AG31]|uniref:Uncharacterized protein n=1 Tax=Melampsora larici-populina (strain 98AG31 / pathotype 3-4-7) TaxID=747676 RepID=F4S952_MELLP|nr:uncharacterized protein MELLADRAFT_113216 [Melampsora larici-populina 98AG31]EGF98759.1 hypothetical protein MELLADRAFT_113216 [Melampsora larici-populina 98AG31]
MNGFEPIGLQPVFFLLNSISRIMKQFNLEKSSGCAALRVTILGLLCFAQIQQITCVQLGRFALTKRMAELPRLAEEQVKALKTRPQPTPEEVEKAWNHPLITENVLFKDEKSQQIINHVKTSPYAMYFDFIGDITSLEASKGEHGQKTSTSMEYVLQAELKRKSASETLGNISLLKLLEEFKESPKSELEVVGNIFARVRDDHAKAMKIATKYSEAVEAGKYAMILDNEADDLLYLWANFADGLIPKVIITYGGFVELRFQAVKQFVAALCKHYEVEDDQMPKVYKGFAHPYAAGQKRHSYDLEEGIGHIDEELRTQYIEKSQALEKELKDADGNWHAGAWDHDEFKDGLEALKTLIDNSEYTAIAVLTCPATVAHLISKDEKLAKKIGVTMSSPWSWSWNKEGVRYRPAFNGGRQIPVMNQLLNSEVDFIGVGGGTARTKGMRTIHDAKHGSGAAEDKDKYYAEKGLENLEKVLSTDSEVEFLRIIALAGQNITRPTWRWWDKSMSKLFKFLGIKPIDRPNLESMREVPEGYEDLKGKAVRTEPKKPKLPGALDWGLDGFLSWSKIWLIWLNPIQWQAPSADLHALITTTPAYLQAISGVARYAAGSADEGRLVRFVKPEGKAATNEKGVFYSVTDMNFQVVIDKLQGMLNGIKQHRTGRK